MKVLSKAKRVLTCLLVCTLVLTGVVGAAPANTVQAASPKYLVLIENEKGEWTGYLKLAYKSANGGIYVYAKSLCAKLGFTYKNLGNGKFTISKNSSCYLKYQKGMKTYTYTRNSKSIPWDCDLYAGKLVIAGKGYQGGKLAIWNSVPTTKKAPDYYYNGSVGTVQVQDIVGVAMDDQYLYVADRSAGKTYVFKGIPTESSKPLYTLNHAGILNADNGKLTIADESAWIYDIAKLASGDKSVINLNEAYISTFDESGSLTKEKRSLTSVQEVIVGTDGELILSEMNWNQVLYWDSIEDAVAGKKPVVLGFSDKNYTNRELGVSSNQTTVVVHPSESTMYMQSGLAYDGMNLWVGEFKFSSRLVLFRKQ